MSINHGGPFDGHCSQDPRPDRQDHNRHRADPKIPLDTNSVERALRGVAVGRKNHYGSRSERGTRTAALFYSLIDSAKLCGVEPRAYLREATLRAVRNRGAVTLARELKSSES